MAALQPSVGGLTDPATDFTMKSFASALLSSSLPTHTSDPTRTAPDQDQTTSGLHKGLPSIAFTDSHMTSLSKSFSWSLVAKFSQGYNKTNPKLGRPSVADLYKYFVAMDFKQPFSLGLLDNRHAVIHFRCEEDFIRLYSRSVWYVGSITMRIFKWSPFFRVDKESSVVPLWISFPRLPLQFFQKEALFPISQLLGQPLRMDAATASLKRPSVARVQVELDVLQPRPEKVWIQMGSREGYWQRVVYENVPSYCCHCWHLGHAEEACHVHNPELKSAPIPPPSTCRPSASQPASHNQVYVPKRVPVSDPILRDSTDPSPPIVTSTASMTPIVTFTGNPPPVLHSQEVGSCSQPIDQGVDAAFHAHVPASDQGVAAANQSHVSGVPVVQQIAVVNDAATFDGTPIVTKLANATAPPTVGKDVGTEPVVEDVPTFPALREHVQAQHVSASAGETVGASSLVTYKSALLDGGPGVAQDLDESVPAHALVVYQPDVPAKTSILNPHANLFDMPPIQHHRAYAAYEAGIGYNDSDYYPETQGSDDPRHDDFDDTDDHTYEDITDGSEGTHSTKKKKKADRRKLQGISKPLATKDELHAQSRLLEGRIRKRGRPPGSRNRTFFDVQRTMSTRATKSTSD